MTGGSCLGLRNEGTNSLFIEVSAHTPNAPAGTRPHAKFGRWSGFGRRGPFNVRRKNSNGGLFLAHETERSPRSGKLTS